MTAEREPFDPEAAARISAALVKAIAEAKAMADAETFGPELHDVVRHAGYAGEVNSANDNQSVDDEALPSGPESM